MLSQLGANGQRYLVINFDLNFLKRTNDRFGHATGDKYLKSFAGILTEVFSDATGICRMGGDEFMVAYQKAPDEKTVQEKLSQMKKLESKEEGSLPDGVIIDAAYGYAYSDENGPVVYLEAIERDIEKVDRLLGFSDYNDLYLRSLDEDILKFGSLATYTLP